MDANIRDDGSIDNDGMDMNNASLLQMALAQSPMKDSNSRQSVTSKNNNERTPSKSWKSAIDDASGDMYYYNEVTGESKWEQPSPAKGSNWAHNWIKYTNEDGHEYLYNEKTCESRWLLSEDDYDSAPTADAPVGSDNYDQINALSYNSGYDNSDNASMVHSLNTNNDLDNNSSHDRIDKEKWESAIDSNTNSKYYYNVNTLESQWETPAKVRKERQELAYNQSTKNDKMDSMASSGDALTDFLEPEDSKANKRFESMKVSAVELRHVQDLQSSDMWIEYQGINDGPIFYGKFDTYGGQWEMPSAFSKEQTLLTTSKPSSRVGSPMTNLDGIRNRSPGSTDIINNRSIYHTLPSELSSQVESVKAQVQGMYHSIRSKDKDDGGSYHSITDSHKEYTILQQKHIDSSAKWDKIASKQSEPQNQSDDDDDDANVHVTRSKGNPSGKANGTSSSSSSNNNDDFNIIYARSIVVKQIWPWTCLSDIQNDRIFYRNETGDYFQFETPDEFVSTKQKNHSHSGSDSDIDGDEYEEAEADEDLHRSASYKGKNVSKYVITHGDASSSMVQRFKNESSHRRTIATNKATRSLISTQTAAREQGVLVNESNTVTSSSGSSSSKSIGSVVSAEYILKKYNIRNGDGGGYPSASPTATSGNGDNNGSSSTDNHMDLKSLQSGYKSATSTRSDNVSVFRKRHNSDYSSKYHEPPSVDKRVLSSIKDDIKRPEHSLVDKYMSKKTVPLATTSYLEEDSMVLLDRLRRMIAPAPRKKKDPEADFSHLDGPKKKQQLRLQKIKDAQEAEKAKLSLQNELAHQSFQIRELAEFMIDLSGESSEDSWLEQEVFSRHMLEASVMQRSQLVMPISLREAKAYHPVGLHIVCPNTFTAADFKREYVDKHAVYSVIKGRNWDVYHCLGHLPIESKKWVVYVHKKTGVVQGGVPFDIYYRENRSVSLSLEEEDWPDYERKYHCQKQMPKLMQQAKLLSDSHSSEENLLPGLLFYSSNRDEYSRDGKFDSTPYDYSTSNRNRTSIEVMKMRKRRGKKTAIHRTYKHLPSRNLDARRTIKPTGSDRNAWIRLPPLMNRQLNEVYNGKKGNLRDIIPDTDYLNLSATSITANIIDEASMRVAGNLSAAPSPYKILHGLYSQSPSTHLLQSPAVSPVKSFDDTLDITQSMNQSMDQFNPPLSSGMSVIGPGLTNTADEFESFLDTMKSRVNLAIPTVEPSRFNVIMDNLIRDDCTSLTFERCLSSDAFDEYNAFIAKLIKNPLNPVLLYKLALWLYVRGLGKEAYAVVVRANEVLRMNRQIYQDFALCRIIEMKLGLRYNGIYPRIKSIRMLAQMCPETDVVLAEVGIYMNTVKYTNQSELLFIGALLNNPLCHYALRGYAHVLMEKRNFSSAYRYLNRVPPTSLAYTISQTEMAWLHELMGSKQDVIILQYKSCQSASIQAGKRDRSTSLSCHSTGHFYHARGDVPRAFDYYKRALYNYHDNPFALLLMATLPEHTLSVQQADANYRRGLYLLKSKYRWTAMLAYGEFLNASLKDCYDAERYLLESACQSLTVAVWPGIAYAHFLQYTKGEMTKARRFLKWLLQRRKRTHSIDGTAAAAAASNTYTDGNDSDDEDNDSVDSSAMKAETPTSKDSAERSNDARLENAAVLVSLAYTCFDTNDYNKSIQYARAALQIDPQHTSAHRCLGLTHWLNANSKDDAVKHLTLSLKHANSNPYTYRTCAVVLAMEGKYEEAYNTMSTAIHTGNNHALSWRAVGIMAYLYTGNKEKAIAYLSKAYTLSGCIDMEAIRLKGQILMELQRYSEARICFQHALLIKCTDRLSQGCLAMALAALGHTSPKSVDYKAKYASNTLRNNATAISNIDDPEELFQLSIDFNTAAAPTSGTIADAGDGDSYDSILHADLFYWYGMYHMKRESAKGTARAAELFLQCINCRDQAPHPLAIYMLGWIEESSNNLVTAEKYYCHSLQIDPMDPLQFLRLSQLVSDTYTYVKGVTKTSEKIRKNKRQQSYHEDAEDQKAQTLDKIPKVKEMRKRMVLHERVMQLARLRRQQMKKHLLGLHTPGKLVYIDPFWLDRIHHAFSMCDDWAWLLRTKKGSRQSQDNAPTQSIE